MSSQPQSIAMEHKALETEEGHVTCKEKSMKALQMFSKLRRRITNGKESIHKVPGWIFALVHKLPMRHQSASKLLQEQVHGPR